MDYAVGMDIRMIRHTGIGTHIRGLLESWIQSGEARGKGFSLFGNQGSSDSYADLPVHNFRSPIYSVQEQIEYPFCLSRCRLWHAPHYNVPLSKSNARLVVTIHDLIHWIFRKDFYSPLQALYAKTMLSQAVAKASRIITVSQKTREDLIHYFEADPDRIAVIPEGVNRNYRELGHEQK
ncbi:MAG TPA: glycosyltransferase, partial [bacterium]|nr:glycosyltransferase [bacterium]